MCSLEWHFGIVLSGSAKLRYITSCVSVRVSPGAFLIHIQTSYIIIMKLYLCLYWNKGDDFFFLLFFSQRMQIESVSVMQQENEIIFYRVASLFQGAISFWHRHTVRYSHLYGLVRVSSRRFAFGQATLHFHHLSCGNSMRESALLTQCCWSMVSDGKTLVWQFNCTSTCSLLAIVAACYSCSLPLSTLDSLFVCILHSLHYPSTNGWVCVCKMCVCVIMNSCLYILCLC